MKSIKCFENNKGSKNFMNKVFGGRINNTGALYEMCDGSVVYEDEWDDKDNNGKFSGGDTICYNYEICE